MRSSIESLPNELLLSVFRMATMPPFHPRPYPRDFLLPYCLSHVSKRFRALTIGTPSLWTLVFVELKTPLPRLRFLTNLFLKRSRPLPFHLEIRADGESGATNVLDIFTPQFDRCRSLSIYADDVDHFTRVASSFLQIPAPSLEYLNCMVYNMTKPAHLQELFKGIAPSLIRVLLRGVVMEGWNSSTLSNLSTLDLGSWRHMDSWEGWPNIFTHTTSLENLRLRSIPYRFFETTPPSIPIPSLRSLALFSLLNDQPIFRMLSVFSTPSLESLALIQIHPSFAGTGWAEFICQAASHRAGSPLYPNLRSLVLSGVPLGAVGRAFIGAFPGITHLSVECPDVMPILDMLVPSHKPQSSESKSFGSEEELPWPALRHLTLNSFDVPACELHQVIRTRIEYGRPISEVYVRGDRKRNEIPEALRWDGMGGTVVRKIGRYWANFEGRH
ncbi:hypothetical protein JAAARDRAFT_630109 [Jaapia argillacea MUCL 33604]|uniref:Uncharacterized protein n=1 Tax=Jaapia argillacea MUCL 33604 TaxID=933084 RepID=A0A067Q0P3_9AGAM|nr:hypothetical protein JAAARDRAFT_630109 [Jaapia argillacea MUCL 33604]